MQATTQHSTSSSSSARLPISATPEQPIHNDRSFVLVGRTNVGKTTLFNRLIGRAKGMVSAEPHTTRDHHEGVMEWTGSYWNVVDTAGAIGKHDCLSPIDDAIRDHTERAIDLAAVIGFVVDAQTGVTAEDRQIATELRKKGVPVIVIANKADNPRLRKTAHEFNRLGWRDLYPVSAINGSGIGDVLDHLKTVLPTRTTPSTPTIRVSIIGKPNVGKSTLLNALVGSDRVIVSAQAHTTREPIDTLIRVGEHIVQINDTAGIRRHRTRSQTLETKGVDRTLTMLETTDVAVFVVDPFNEGLTKQDLHLAQELVEARAGVAIIINKWDVPKEKTSSTINEWTRLIRATFPQLSWAPILFISALEGKRVNDVLAQIVHIHEERSRTIDPDLLTKLLKDFLPTLPHQTHFSGKRSDKPRYVEARALRQVRTNPPRFELFSRRNRPVPVAVIDLLEKRLRSAFGLEGTPVVIEVIRRQK